VDPKGVEVWRKGHSSYSYWVQDVVFEECGEETSAFMKGGELPQ